MILKNKEWEILKFNLTTLKYYINEIEDEFLFSEWYNKLNNFSKNKNILKLKFFKKYWKIQNLLFYSQFLKNDEFIKDKKILKNHFNENILNSIDYSDAIDFLNQHMGRSYELYFDDEDLSDEIKEYKSKKDIIFLWSPEAYYYLPKKHKTNNEYIFDYENSEIRLFEICFTIQQLIEKKYSKKEFKIMVYNQIKNTINLDLEQYYLELKTNFPINNWNTKIWNKINNIYKK
ncbi:hypothetical protein [Mesomycoplasma neurolyticum]|uniref:Uncharacterized protein n=1 Tax=Mesomycoplasma neurolyticum TaxID=2120 RepID=A0A449A520_9BACT|nr:hypothetical protein [Mesomycoplasma neurolyticum]VEU59326.1 Uncharacterised protein [Mesomycoplasma neurolyticum]